MGVLMLMAFMQGKKFKDKLPAQPVPMEADVDSDEGSDDSTESRRAKGERFPIKHRRQSDRAGEGFVSSIRGLFNLQKKKAKALVLRTMRGPEEFDLDQTSSSDNEGNAPNSPLAHTMNINKAKRLLRLQARKSRHTLRTPRGQ